MKQLLLFFILFSGSSVMLAQSDTLYLKVDEVSAAANEQVCVSMRAENFSNIIALQLAFHFDPVLLSLDTVRAIGLGANPQALYSHNTPGTILFSWSDIIGVSAVDGDPILEFCFTSLADAVSVPVDITPTNDFILEAVNGDVELMIIKTENGIYSPAVSSVDCTTDDLCFSSIITAFDKDTVQLLPESFLKVEIEEFLNCTRTKSEDLFLINLSSRNAEPTKSIKLYCGNLRDTVYVGLALRTVGTDEYWVHCTVPVEVRQISDRSCLMTLSPSDPSVCQDVEVEALSAETTISPEQLIDLSAAPDVFYNYVDIDQQWSYNSDLEKRDLVLNCTDYNVPQSLSTWLVITPPEGPPNPVTIVVQDFCTHEVLITAAPDVCETTVGEGEALLKVENLIDKKKVDFFINGAPMDRLSTGLYKLDLDALRDEDNVITFEPFLEGIDAAVSTLDLFWLMKALREEEFLDSYQVLGADADRSGSVTSKDFVRVWEYILGIRDLGDAGGFIAPLLDEIEQLNYLDFNNTYSDFRFNLDELDVEEGLDLGVGLIGDVFGTKAARTKSKKSLNLNFAERYVQSGEIIEVEFEIENKEALSALFLGLDEEYVIVQGMTANGSFNSTLSYDAVDDYRFSYVDIDNKRDLSLQIKLVAKKDGLLSELLVLSNYIHEAIDQEGQEYEISLAKNIEVDNFKIYPNPSTDVFSIDIPNSYLGGDLQVTNVLGKIVSQRKIQSSSTSMSKSDLSGAGMYVVSLMKENKTKAIKVLIQ